jgi:transcriptional regulator with XRE-family HTH domain
MSETHSFGYWVRRRRKALDLTQAELARLVGCAEVTIRGLDRGRAMTVDKAIAYALGEET